MLKGAMDELQIGNPWSLPTDVGPVIDQAARQQITEYIDQARNEKRLLHELEVQKGGEFVAPTIIQVQGILDIEKEVFGPVLHFATFQADELHTVLNEINEAGYGLTVGLHSRIDDRVQRVLDTAKVGNCYINRNQIGAVVGSQPFGGEGLSGTGPKAGGPHYLRRFLPQQRITSDDAWSAPADLQAIADALRLSPNPSKVHGEAMPGPTGESNQLYLTPRGPVLCLGPGKASAQSQADAVTKLGGIAVQAKGLVYPNSLKQFNLAAAIWWGDEDTGRTYELALAARSGPVISLITSQPDAAHVLHERLVSVDTTAAGGNPELLIAAARNDPAGPK
jgi:RHH-type proline utilization regulon transcriptional repressor/proline dehydrogenase/delta 1-pyrroline-5-carboxylate dehydrogenase